MCFSVFQNEKTPFQPVKTRSSKSPKIEIFPKGLTHGLSQKGAMLFLKSEKKLNFFKGVRQADYFEKQTVEKFQIFDETVDCQKNSIFSPFFEKASVQSRKPFFPSRISTKIYFKAYFFDKQRIEKF